MTLQEAKDEITEYYYGGMFKWDALQDHIKVTLFEKVLDLYTRSKWYEACEAQRKAYLSNWQAVGYDLHSETISIENAPKPEFQP